jgi:diaminopimelate decarboxylase
LARERGTTARVSLRVNPEITLDAAHDYIKTGGRAQVRHSV